VTSHSVTKVCLTQKNGVSPQNDSKGEGKAAYVQPDSIGKGLEGRESDSRTDGTSKLLHGVERQLVSDVGLAHESCERRRVRVARRRGTHPDSDAATEEHHVDDPLGQPEDSNGQEGLADDGRDPGANDWIEIGTQVSG
jgi:hypothetical protein